MNNSIYLSRIVTCYRQWTLIERWIGHTALHQQDVEWIVVNDDPKDPPTKYCREQFQKRAIRVLTAPYNLGRSNARNWAAGEANGKWIDFVDGDDFPLVVDHSFFSKTDASLLAFPVVGFTDRDKPEPTCIPKIKLPWTAKMMLQKELFPGFIPIDYRPCGTIWKKKDFLNIGGFDARFDDACEDCQLVWKAYTHKFKIARADRPKQLYYQDNDSGNSSRLSAASMYSLFRLFHQHGDQNLRNFFYEQQVECLKQVRWQAFGLLHRRKKITNIYRIKEIIKILLSLFRQR